MKAEIISYQEKKNKDISEKIVEAETANDKISDIYGNATDDSRSVLERLNELMSRLNEELGIQMEECHEETDELLGEISSEKEHNEELISAAFGINAETIDVNMDEVITSAEESNARLDEMEEILGSSFDSTVDSAIKSMLDKSVISDKLPSGSKGEWISGEKGNGVYKLDPNAVFTCGKVTMTGAEIGEKYGDCVEYKGNEPDFSNVAVNNEFVSTVNVTRMPTNRKESYRIAEEECAKRSGKSISEVRRYMSENNLTWHETADRKSIMAVPSIINAAFDHTGGISKEQSFETVSQVMEKKRVENNSVGYAVDRIHNGGIVNKKEFEDALDKTKKGYRQVKQNKF